MAITEPNSWGYRSTNFPFFKNFIHDTICRGEYVVLGYRNKEDSMSKKNSCGELLPETKRLIKQEITKRLVIDEKIMDDVSLNSWSITSNKKINLSISITLCKDLLNGT